MPVWNTLVPVVGLVAGNSAEEAIESLKSVLDAAGFTVHDGYPGCDAFESEAGIEPEFT